MADRLWRTNSGHEIPYDKLEDKHLLAILRRWVLAASAQVGLNSVQILLERWPEEAHDEQAEIWGRDWRSIEAPRWFSDLETIAKTRGLDMTQIVADGEAARQLVETSMLRKSKALDVPVEEGLQGLLEATLKKDVLDDMDHDLVRMVLAAGTRTSYLEIRK